MGESADVVTGRQKMQRVVSREANARLSHVDFSVARSTDVARISHVEALNRNMYSRSDPDTPQPFGPLDGRMGLSPSERDKLCKTCGLDAIACPGHFGHVRLHLPVFHIGYVKEILNILKVICKSCSRVLLPPASRARFLAAARKAHDKRSKALVWSRVLLEGKKQRVCNCCGALNGDVKKYKGAMKFYHEKKAKVFANESAKFRAEFKDAQKHNPDLTKENLELARQDIDALIADRLLRQISDTDCELLNMSPKLCRPEDLLVRNMLIPPACLRPTVKMGSSGTNEDDLTVKMADIIHVNTCIRQNIEKGGATGILKENWDFLQQVCAQYINSDMPGLPRNRDIKPIRALVQRLKGKTGRFRGTLSGKRVDFSSRTVISPDPNLSVEEVGVPVLCAKILTYPERVTRHNIASLRQAVRNGTDVHPGANCIFKRDNRQYHLRYGNREEKARDLAIGDVVERHLRDGDIVLFNRQPSLHRMSIMAHRARVMPWRTFRFNECVCTPYNADFDGDEMNLHLPQTEEARAEAELLMGIKHNLVTPGNGSPLICAIQDFITASYLITQRDVFMDRSKFCQTVSHMCWPADVRIDLPTPAIIHPVCLWTGKQVMTMLLRPNNDPQWPLVNLILKARCYTSGSGVMCPRDGHVVIRNSALICGVLDKVSLGGNPRGLVNNLRTFHSEDAATACLNRLAKLCSRWLGSRGFSIGITDVTPGANLLKRKAELVKQGYEECKQYLTQYESGKLEAAPGCTVTETVEANCNGVLSKIRSDAGKVCLTELDYNNNPTLIMAVSGSKGSQLNISQMVACCGQQTISNKRAPEGFVNRTLPHFAIGSRMPQAKGFVKNSFYSGLTATEFFFHTMAGREGLVDTAVKTAETGYLQRRLVKALEDLCVLYDGSVRTAESRVVQFTYGDDGLDPVAMIDGNNPVSFSAALTHTEATQSALGRTDALSGIAGSRSGTDVDYITRALRRVDLAANSSELGAHSSKWVNGLQRFIKDQSDATTERQRALPAFVDACVEKYIRSGVEPGTAVGAIAAQSIGEPGTQMTLKTFHFAGVASMNITMGVPRIKEIINASASISSPIITAPLNTSNDLRVARIVKGRIEKTTLGEIAKCIDEVYESQDCYLEVLLDLEAVSALQLAINVDTVIDSILAAKTPKLKNYTVLRKAENLLRIYPPDNLSRFSLLGEIQKTKAKLPHVTVVGVPTVRRAVINEVAAAGAAAKDAVPSRPFEGDFIDPSTSEAWRIDLDEKGITAMLTTTGRQFRGRVNRSGKLVVRFGKSSKTASWDGRNIAWSDGSAWRAKHYHLLIEGEGLLEILGTPGVQSKEATSNHVLEMERVLGIEAARRAIIHELRTTMKVHGLSVDSRHFSLLADIMTYTGKVLGITRWGLAKMDKSVLMLASFENTSDHLFDAAVHGYRDAISGVSECIIMGKPIPVGTGLFELSAKLPQDRKQCVSGPADLQPPLVERLLRGPVDSQSGLA